MSRAHGNALVRRLLSLVVVLMAMLFGASAWAAPEVRTGVTEVEEPEQLAEKLEGWLGSRNAEVA